MPNDQVLGFWGTGNFVQVLGTYMIIRYLDPQDRVVRIVVSCCSRNSLKFHI